MRGTKQITLFIIIIILLRSTIESDLREKKVYIEFESQANMHPKSAINLPSPTIKHSNKGNQPKPLKLDIKTHYPHWSLQQKK